MKKLRTLELFAYRGTRNTEKFWLVKMAGIVSAFCLAATMTLRAQSFTSLDSFDGADGVYSYAGLVQGNDGNFYGTTYGGGSGGGLGVGFPGNCTYGCGTVFKITPGGTFTTVYNFCSLPACADGNNPVAGLIQGTDGNFYGTTLYGGANSESLNAGTVFKVTPEGSLTTLYSFCSQPSCADGVNPYAGLIQATDGNFYGTTSGGGNDGHGTIFQITPEGSISTLYLFCSRPGCPDGAVPWSAPIQATDGNFYGTTSGGNQGGGTVYEITPDGTLTTLYQFQYCPASPCPNGSHPIGGLMQVSNGNFYGTASEGGSGSGTIFEITPGGSLTTIYSFCSQKDCRDGASPWSAPIRATDGSLYGTTGGGGDKGAGTIFELTPTGTFTTLHSFVAAEGLGPLGQLIQGNNGIFYGTTFEGGAENDGTIFTFGLATGMPSQASLKFGAESIGVTSPAKSDIFTNDGTTVLTLSGVAISGNFAISSNTCTGAVLTAGKTCKVAVTFTPTASGAQTGMLTFIDNAVNNPQTVSLSGTGEAQAALTPASYTFKETKVGITSAAHAFTLKNTLPTTLTGISFSTAAPFAVSTSTCGTTLDSKQSCTISVTFSPTQTGAASGTLTVSDSANNSPQSASLSGTGD